jgi:ABC-type sugar transport system permease subunit
VTPLLVLLVLIVAYPLGQIVWTSFFRNTFIHPEPRFIGLANYSALLHSPDFWRVAWQSAIWTVGTVAGQFVVGLAIALLLNQRFRGRTALRALVLVPWVMPGVLVGILWRFMYDPYLGLVNYVGETVHLWTSHPALLSDTNHVLLALIVAAIWKGAPFSVLMYLAALQSRSADLFEAAHLDGANTFQAFRHVTLPSIAPVIRATLILTIIWTFNYFDLIYVATGGGPDNASQIAPTYIYKLAFINVDYGLASAFGVISIGVLAIFSYLYLRQLREEGALA